MTQMMTASNTSAATITPTMVGTGSLSLLGVAVTVVGTGSLSLLGVAVTVAGLLGVSITVAHSVFPSKQIHSPSVLQYPSVSLHVICSLHVFTVSQSSPLNPSIHCTLIADRETLTLPFSPYAIIELSPPPAMLTTSMKSSSMMLPSV